MYKRLADKSETKLKYYYHKDEFGAPCKPSKLENC